MKGVYLITNTITGAKYVGQSVDIQRRFTEHKTPNASLKSKSALFVSDIRRYGIESFRFEVLEECSEAELRTKEKKWIDKLQPEYNVQRTPRAVSEERRKQISATLKRRWEEKPEIEKRAIIERQLIGPRKGHPVSEETREKLRRANLGQGRYGVRIAETGVVYRTAKECAKALGCSYFTILNGINGKTKTTKGYHLERVETIRDECSGVGRK